MIRSISRGCHWIADRWCYAMHPNAMWPIGHRYRCAKCGRSYPIPWANLREGGRAKPPRLADHCFARAGSPAKELPSWGVNGGRGLACLRISEARIDPIKSPATTNRDVEIGTL
jgi:hypothetical protein